MSETFSGTYNMTMSGQVAYEEAKQEQKEPQVIIPFEIKRVLEL